MLYKDAAHAYDDDQVILLTKERVPQLSSRLVPVQAGDEISLSTYVHYSSAPAKKTWQKIGATAAGVAIGSLPYLLDRGGASGERNPGNDLWKQVAPLAGAGIATLPFVLSKRKGKAISKNISIPKSKNGHRGNGLFVPDAYLSYTFYDVDGKVLSSDVQSIDKHAKDAWQELSLQAVAPQPGYVQVEVGNGSKRPVWFEQMSLTRNRSINLKKKPESGVKTGGDDLQNIEEIQGQLTTNSMYYCTWTYVITSTGKEYCGEIRCVKSGGGGGTGGGSGGEHGGETGGGESGESDGASPDPRFNTSQLEYNELREFQATLEQMERNCFYKSMLDNLSIFGQPTIMMANIPSEAAYDANNNTIKFNSINNIQRRHASPEIFHAFQQQRTLYLDDILNRQDNRGQSNVEFEEKFMQVVADAIEIRKENPDWYGGSDPVGADGLFVWVLQQMDLNGGKFPTSFNSYQKQAYFNFLQSFQQHHANHPDPLLRKTYGAPLDTSPLFTEPTNVFFILERSDC